MLKQIAEIITDNIDEITRRWVDALRASSRTETHNSMLTAEIVNGTKGMLSNLAQTIEVRDAPDHETLPLYLISGRDSEAPITLSKAKRATRPLGGPFVWAQQAAAAHGKLRLSQGYQLHELVLEYITLRQILFDILRVESAVRDIQIPAEVAQYINRLLDELLLSAIENYYDSSVRDLEKRALHDPLTQLYNKDYFRRRMNEELRRAVRYGEPMTLLLLDMDGLKPVNDTFGHPAGDAAIVAVASAIRNSTRQSDIAARYGGDEFAVILPETTRAQAFVLAERIMRSLDSNTIVVAQSDMGQQSEHTDLPADAAAAQSNSRPLMVPVPSVSVGLATYPDDARNPEMLIAKADSALYTAKKSGRNCIVSAGEGMRRQQLT